MSNNQGATGLFACSTLPHLGMTSHEFAAESAEAPSERSRARGVTLTAGDRQQRET